MRSYKCIFGILVIVTLMDCSIKMDAQRKIDKSIRIKWTKEMLNKLHQMNSKPRKPTKTANKKTVKPSTPKPLKANSSPAIMKKDSASTRDFANKDLINKLVENDVDKMNKGVRPIPGMSVFQGFYETHTAKGTGITVDWRWLTPKDFIKNLAPPERIDGKNRLWLPHGSGSYGPMPQMHFGMMNGTLNYGQSCSLEDIAEFLFKHRRRAKDHWSDYASYIPEKALKNVEVEAADSQVHINLVKVNTFRQNTGKYKILYFFYDGNLNMNANNLKHITEYANTHGDKYDLFPCSDIDSISQAALFLKRQRFFKQAYTISREQYIIDKFCKIIKWKDKTSKPTLFILDDQNNIVKAVKEEDIKSVLQEMP